MLRVVSNNRTTERLKLLIGDVSRAIADSHGIDSDNESVSAETNRLVRHDKGVRIKPSAEYVALLGDEPKETIGYSAFSYDDSLKRVDSWEVMSYDAGRSILEFAFSTLSKYREFARKYIAGDEEFVAQMKKLDEILNDMSQVIKSELSDDDDDIAARKKEIRECYARAFKGLGEIGLSLWW